MNQTGNIMQSLKESPLFNLSLSTKELFHSNFLYWIGCTHYEIFIEILKQLGFTFNDSKGEKAVIKREYKNFDLCLILGGKPICVIENKVKSIPRFDQIEQYDSLIKKYSGTASSCCKFLLTLANEFPNKNKIIKLGWKIITYNDLYNALNGLSNNINEDEKYHKNLITDYCMFIKGLNELSQSWLQGNTTLPYHAEKEEKELRIGDLKEKLLYSKLCIEIGEKIVEIGEKIGYPIKYGEKTQKIIEEFRSHKQRRIYIDFNYTNQQRLLDIKFPINNEYVVGIQIQGKQYRHFIEWYDNKELSDKRWKSVSNEKLIKNFFDVTGKTGNFIKESKKEYNQFGNSFLYQYRTIKETTKDKIIEEIISVWR